MEQDEERKQELVPMSEGKDGNGVSYHLISDVRNLSETLKGVFESSWVSTVEQAVGFLCASGIDVEGKDDFLQGAKELLGEEAYLRYSTPLKQPPLGCDPPKAEVKVVTEPENGNGIDIEK